MANPSSVLYNKTQQKFIVLDAATTAFGRMGHISVKYIPCSSVACNAQTEKRHFNKRIKIACWVAGCVLHQAKFCLLIIQAKWENTTLSIEGADSLTDSFDSYSNVFLSRGGLSSAEETS